MPKFEKFVRVEDYRPISLCNMVMKVIPKSIANRLCAYLPILISPNQGAFLKNRSIIDSILTAQEISHYKSKRCIGKNGFLSIKVDMTKAYYRVEWDFLGHMLLVFIRLWFIKLCSVLVLCPTRWRLMTFILSLSIQDGDLDRVIHYRRIYSFYVRNGFQPSWISCRKKRC